MSAELEDRHLVCLGNELVWDDGVGFRLGRIIRSLPLPETLRVSFCQGVALDLPWLLRAHEQTLMVDAMSTGAPPGTVTLLDPDQLGDLAEVHVAGHAAGLAEALAVVRQVCPEHLPGRLGVLGVEAQVLHRYGVGLTPPVRRALPEATHNISDFFGFSDSLRALALEQARIWMDRDPDPADCPG